MAAPSNKPTLEAMVTRYRREVARDDAAVNTELEIRLQDLSFETFAAIYEALLKGAGGAGEGKLTQVVSAIMNVRRGADAGDARGARPMRIREIHFEGGVRAREQFVRKEQLMLPFRVSNPAGVSYIVSLAAETTDRAPSMDATALIRVKARASFMMSISSGGTAGEADPPLTWRVDATVTRQIAGADAASSLKLITGQMFAPASPAALLPGLGLASGAAAVQLYRYEVEAELLGPADRRDMLRPGDVTAAADALLALANPTQQRDAALAAEVRRLATHLGGNGNPARDVGLKRLLPPALAITRAEYRDIYPPTGLYLYDKTDGKRAVGGAHDGRGVILSDTLTDGFPPTKDPRCAGDTYLDCELVDVEGVPTLFAFDAIAIAGETVADDPFEKRVGRIAEGVEILRAAGLPAVAKVAVHVAGSTPAELERDFRGVLEAKRPYAVDGVILVEPGASYLKTRNLKWKDLKDNTIDLLARRAPPGVLGQRPFVDLPGHELYFLFVGINGALFESLGVQRCPGYAELFQERFDNRDGRGIYFPIQFAPSDAPLAYMYQHPKNSEALDGKVVEMRRVMDNADDGTIRWELTRIREDRRRDLETKRYYGNDYHVAETIWLNYVDQFPAEQLWDGPGADYFQRAKSDIYRAQTACISFVKEQRIAAMKHARWVIDVGAGKGQDLGRYLAAEVTHLVAIDQDRAALAELVRRRYGFAERGGRDGRREREHRERERGERGDSGRAGRRAATTVHVLVANANEPHKATLAKLERFNFERDTADAVVCNLAVHYFCASVESIRNFVAFARGCVKVGGVAVLTIMAGEAVHAAFAAARVPEGGTWDIFEQPTSGGAKTAESSKTSDNAAPPSRKYSLRRLYAADTLEAAGQQIGVMLPFSRGEYYTEYLVNAKTFTTEFAARGFSVASSASIAKSIPDFEARNRAVAGGLTAGDKRYLALYSELVFRRDY